LIEGMTIAAYAVGASKGYIYLRSEYPLAKDFLIRAIDIALDNNYLGNNIQNSDFNFDIELRIGAGSYVCGEETAMMESIEGRRGLVRSKPPLPAINGLFKQPTLINNVVTLATIPALLLSDQSDFSQIGSNKSIGTMPFQLSGNVKHGGLIETRFDISLNEIIEDFGSGTKSGEPIHAIQIGGPLGIYLSSSMLDTTLTIESLQELKGSVGHGGIIVFDNSVDMAEQAKFAMEFCVKESCGKCTPCRIGSVRGVEIIERLQKNKTSKDDANLLHDLCETLESTSLCAMGEMTPNPIHSIIEFFPNELIEK
jgi:formate dehydrogenase iron-sulfur subunit